jgi:hypothetical protein
VLSVHRVGIARSAEVEELFGEFKVPRSSGGTTFSYAGENLGKGARREERKRLRPLRIWEFSQVWE